MEYTDILWLEARGGGRANSDLVLAWISCEGRRCAPAIFMRKSNSGSSSAGNGAEGCSTLSRNCFTVFYQQDCNNIKISQELIKKSSKIFTKGSKLFLINNFTKNLCPHPKGGLCY